MSQSFKVTTFDGTYSQRLASGDTILGGSSGSNAGYLGGDVIGGPGETVVVSLRDRVALSSNMGDNTVGSVLTTIQSAPWTAAFAMPSNTGSVGSNFLTKNEGGQDTISAHGSMGATETFDPTDGNVHTGTLNANCTFTLNAPVGTGACTLELRLTQDSTGGWVITWPGSVTVIGTLVTTASTTSIIILETLDGGTTWVAVVVGSSSASFATPAIVLGSSAAAGAASTVIRSDSTIAAFDATVPVTQAFSDAAATGSAAFAARRDHVHGMPATPSSGGASEHAHIVSETHLSNGSTVTWTLDNAYEVGSVIAWNTTTLARLTVTEVLPDQATVSAAGTTGDSIVFDYAATLA